jgi:organic hydroperoxide reductase OsmC/OhrA
MDERSFTVALTLQDGYAFTVDFGEGGGGGTAPGFVADEPPPLGAGRGPNAARLLAAAIGSCLGASLLFCLRKAHIEVAGLRTTVAGTLVRNERGRLRVGEIRVRLAPAVAPEARERIGRCLELFEDFCVVTESVRRGLPVAVEVVPEPAPGPV